MQVELFASAVQGPQKFDDERIEIIGLSALTQVSRCGSHLLYSTA